MSLQEYCEFIKTKQVRFCQIGFEVKENLNPALFSFQRDIVKWALRKGRACLFEDCGLGKTIQQLEWARLVSAKENDPVLIVAPLAVAEQTHQEGIKFGIPTIVCASQKDVKKGICITNYEKLHKFDGSAFCGVVLDESSILKNMAGATRNQIIDMFRHIPHRLACTATPSPNDYMELGNHSEFLGVMTYSEMLSMFFINDSGKTGTWRLKRHAQEREFWEWICSWAVMLSSPADLGYVHDGFELPPLKYIEHKLPAVSKGDTLLVEEASTMAERRRIRKETIQVRCEKAAELVNSTNDQWIIWCGLNDESRLLTKLIDGARELSGSTPTELRTKYMLGFARGEVPRLVTKPSIAGFGMNWQNCNKMVFVGLSDSWEQLYQATRRIWRFGQKRPVEVHIVIEEREGSVLRNIKRKDNQARHMIQSMIAYTKDITAVEVKKIEDRKEKPRIEMREPTWIN